MGTELVKGVVIWLIASFIVGLNVGILIGALVSGGFDDY